MQMNKILSLAFLMLSIIENDSISCVIAGFQKNNKCYLDYNCNDHSFESINNFSQELNNNNNYFNVSSVRTENNNTVIFDNFKNKSNHYYCLQLFGEIELHSNPITIEPQCGPISINYKPDIVLNYGYNELRLPNRLILRNINSLRICSNLYEELNTDALDANINDLNKIYFNDKQISVKSSALLIGSDVPITDIKAIWNIFTKLLYNTKVESIMHIIPAIWDTIKQPLKWMRILK